MTVEPVYTEDRADRIRKVLYVVLGVGVLLVLLAVYALLVLVPDDGDYLASAVILSAVAVGLLGSSATAMRLLPARGRSAKIATVVTGVLLVVCGVAFAGVWIGYLMPLLGLAVLLLALLPDGEAPA